ncbi:MAG: transketolase [Candidatus Harrisonbacteria bacterium RIFCSPLOWO2_02_FULL_45_10c]|uniref:Transketolase n=1 Tax=Candidatus Harrisonbacteria bacterium RIFCSPLOWO2_02_FULL_45_10c TaxID=1798410 RepID=A0A1G1ZS85_9BACT|nr:MAG: transketolase [Candidatus Harrisonbacteria bacterium RIFCSPLOWO2_02_FULL_45_10c]
MGESANISGATKAGQPLYYVVPEEIKKIKEKISDPFLRVKILTDIFRLNALYLIRYTGSGHPGSTFGCLDILTWLWLEEMQNPNESDSDPSDIFFSSKGHDVPALYSLLIGLEKLPLEMIHKLRRLGGLPGHPDIGTPHIAANTGSLGMGISKARGLAQAKRLKGKSGRVYVLTGDGELQEGQFWESLQPAVNGKFSEITAIIDHNKIQSDTWLKNTSSLGNLEDKLRSFGWEVARCDGHDLAALKKVFEHFKKVKDRPQILIADTLKGAGVSFMTKLGEDGFYKFHSGAPNYEQYLAAFQEISGRADKNLKEAGLEQLRFESRDMPVSSIGDNWQRLISAYGNELVSIARERKDLVAMDADLVLDTGLIPFKKEFPERYFECGIAEQDMVSFAGGLALQGVLPAVHSFECFLTTRANEHFYNNATEKRKIIYAGSLAGLLPGMPGHSHQSVRGISVLGAIPGLTLIQPCNEKETRLALRWAAETNPESTYIRLVNIACECPFELPADYKLEIGRGAYLTPEGKDVLIFAYGPVITTEAVKAVKLLREQGISASVVNFPWLNRIDEKWLSEIIAPYKMIVTIDDHYVALGQGVQIKSALLDRGLPIKTISLGLNKIPACGHNAEVLKYHQLDFESIAKVIEKNL